MIEGATKSQTLKFHIAMVERSGTTVSDTIKKVGKKWICTSVCHVHSTRAAKQGKVSFLLEVLVVRLILC